MKGNVILEYFDKLNDENAMFIEFKNARPFFVDNEDEINPVGDCIEIKSTKGLYIVETDEIMGLKICNCVDLINKALLGEIADEMGDS